jgi:S1-C subfamily serine protease
MKAADIMTTEVSLRTVSIIVVGGRVYLWGVTDTSEEVPAGAMVASVAAGSAAERAGVKPGDVILSVDGERIVSAGQLRSRIGLARPGTAVNIELLRDGNRIQAKAVLTSPAE